VSFGCGLEIAGGSSLRIVPMRLAGLFLEKAFFR
jgi:hypothetical protein